MKYLVKRVFKDSVMNVIHMPKSVFETDDQERAARLQMRGFIGPALPEEKSVSNPPVHIGGGWYELATGIRIRGKRDAYLAMGCDVDDLPRDN